MTIEILRESLAQASSNAKDLFFDKAKLKTRKQYFAKGKLGDDGNGAVYAYFDRNGQALYVGEAGRPIKRRMHDQTSPHKEAKWWRSWESIRFLQVHDRTDRLALELLLILALRPTHNSKPGPRDISQMFDANNSEV